MNNINYPNGRICVTFPSVVSAIAQKNRDFEKWLKSRFFFCAPRLGETQVFEIKKMSPKKQNHVSPGPHFFPGKTQILLVFYTDSCSLSAGRTPKKERQDTKEREDKSKNQEAKKSEAKTL